MSDQMFDFDTSKERRQVEEFDRALDRLMNTVNKLDRMDVDRFSKQFEEMTRGQTAATRQVVDAARKMVSDMEQLAKVSGQKFKSFSDFGPVQALISSIRKGQGELKAVLGVALAEMQNQMEVNNRAMVAEATQTAKNVGAAFSDIKTQIGKNLYGPASYKEFFSSFAAGLQGSKGVVEKSARDSASVFSAAFAEEMGRGRNIFKNFEQSLGLAGGSVVKSAKDSAAVFSAAFANDIAQSRQMWRGFETSLGINSGVISKSARDSADVFSEAFSRDIAQSRQMWRGFEQSLGMREGSIRKSARDSAAVFAEAYAVELAKTKQLFSNFEQSIGLGSSRKSARASASVFMDAGLMPKAEEVDKLSSSFKRLTADGNDVHSMARGLASGFGALWLTWGNLVPLFIGAGISNGFVQTAKTGMQVAHTMGIVANLGENTTAQMAALSAEMDRLGKSGPVGPLAIAESMQVLSLAGLKANDILAVTQDVLNFSVAGTTDLKTAADTLVSISTAFGMGSSGFGRVADVVSKAAAESKTSVESFSNAMKTASVIHKQYGVSLEDTATALAAMSQLGIEGTAAGTALRNMYADLSGRSVQVAKVLKAQGIEMRDATGQFKPMITVVGELNDKFQQMTGIGKANLMQALLSERGAKGIVEMLDLIGKSAVGMQGNVTNALVALNEKITESYGFAAINAAKMAQTAQSQFEAVKATLQTSMNEAYRSMEPQLLLIFDALKKAFGSSEFVSGISSLIDVVSRLGVVFAQNMNVIVLYGAALAGLKLAQMGMVAVASAITAADALVNRSRMTTIATVEAETIATNINTAAKARNATAAAATAGAIGTFARILPGIGTAVTVLSGAWMAYEFWQTKSKNASKEAADLYQNNVAKTLSDQAAKLKELNDLRATGLSLTQAQMLLEGRKKAQEAADPYATNVNNAIRDVSEAQAELAKREKFAKDTGNGKDARIRVEEQERRVKAASARVIAAKQEEQDALNRINQEAAKLAAETKRQADLDAAEAKKRADDINKTFGTKGYELGQDMGNKGSKRGQFQSPRDNEIAELEKIQAARQSTLQNGYDNEKKLLESRYQAGLILEGDYQAQSLIATLDYEEKYKALLAEQNTQYVEKYEERYAEISKVRDAASKAGDTQAVERLQQELDNLTNSKKRYTEVNVEKIAKIEADAFLRNALASVKAEGAIAKLTKASNEYWKKQQAEYENTQKQNAIADYYENASKSVLAYSTVEKAAVEAAMQERAKHTDIILDRERQLVEAENAYKAFTDKVVSDVVRESTAYQEEAVRLANAVAKIKGVLGVDKANIETSVNRAAVDAAIRQQDRQVRAFTNGIADAFTTAVFEGGKTGGKQLREFLKKELLREPFTIMLRGVMNSLLGGLTSMLMSAFGGGGGIPGVTGSGGPGMFSMASNAFSLYNMGSQAWTLGSQYFGGTMSGANALGTAWANGTGGGLDALLATNGAYGTAGAGAGGGGGLGAMGGAGAFMAAAAVILNAAGAFRSERRVASGLRGTLGKGDITPWEEWREGGTLFSGPSYNTFNPIEQLTKERDKLRQMRDSGADPSFIANQQLIVDNLEEQYGDMAESAMAQSRLIQKSYDEMRKGAIKMAETLGLSTDKVKDFTTQFGGDKGLNLEGLTPEESQKKIAEALATANNELAQQVIGTWETTTRDVSRVIATNVGSYGEDAQIIYSELTNTITETHYVASEYAKEGEKAIDTLTRLATSLSTVNSTFEMLGYTLLDASLKSADLASKLIEAFGSMEAFTASTTYFFENFYSDSEKQQARDRLLKKTFDEMGLSVPKNAAEYRKLVEAQDLSTEEGRKMYASLLKVAPMFKEVADGAKEVGDSLQDLAKDKLDKAAEAVRKAYRAALDALQLQIDGAQEAVDRLSGLVQLLKDNIRDLYNETAATSKLSAQQGQAYITSALAALKSTGALPDEQKLGESISAVRDGFKNTTYASQFDEDNARLVLAGELSQMVGVLEPQLTTAEAQLQKLTDMYKLMQREFELWEDALDAAENNYSATLDVATAIREFNTAFQEWVASGGNGGTGTDGMPAPHKPGSYGGGGGYSPGPAGRGTTPRVNYGADEALTSFEKFKAWYLGLKNNADPANFDGTKGYKVPDWLKLSGFGAADGTDQELFGQYLFFKNNPNYAKDAEQLYTTGKTSMATDGSTIRRTDLSYMPANVRAYYESNPAALNMAEGFAMDPVLYYQLYTDGPEQFGLDRRTTSFTEWLRTHKWTPNGIVENNNVVEMAGKPYNGTNLVRWDTTTGTLVDFDGKIYTPDGKLVGTASYEMMTNLYGKDFTDRVSNNTNGGVSRSILYQNQVGTGDPTEYYNAIRRNVDQRIGEGWTAQQLLDAVKETGASLDDVAHAYGTTVSVIRENLIKGGATDVPWFANGGFHSGGLRIVGERGWELEATGPSRIWNQDQLAQALVGNEDGSSYDLQIVAELQNIRDINAAMLQEMRLMRQLNQKWDNEGLPMERQETTAPTP